MYYRYKTKKKDRRFLKLFFSAAVILAAVYVVFHYRSKVMFWRISHNRIVSQISQVATISDSADRVTKLKKLAEDMVVYKNENPDDSDSYIYSARVNYNLGIAISGKSFTDLYLDDAMQRISAEQRRCFIHSIRDMSKAIALLDGRDVEPQDMFLLGKSYFFAGYRKNGDIYNLLKRLAGTPEQLSVEDIRFYSVLCLMEGAADEGLSLLEKKGGVEDTVQGRLFKAQLLKNSMKYTEAIIAFQNILKSTDDPYVQKLSYSSLGKIYYSQNLFKESLDQFSAALNFGDDVNNRIWIGKNYYAMGMKDKAKTVWGEVLAADADNQEAKRLLGVQ